VGEAPIVHREFVILSDFEATARRKRKKRVKKAFFSLFW